MADSEKRPDIVKAGKNRLNWLERAQISFVRQSFEPGNFERVVRYCQRTVGSTWIHHFTKNLRHVHGLDRVPKFDAQQSYMLVSNHRSFFDLYVVFGDLVRRGLDHRIVFPVRANFFYDQPLGLFVNGVMSFFAMYPPIFREKRKAPLNLTSLDELAWLLRRGGVIAGIHPEGTRKRDEDPYTFLPAQRGIGRLIHKAHVPVIPVFINGLINQLPKQIYSNFDGTGRPVFMVFGEPIDFGNMLNERATAKIEQAIADRTLEVIGKLGQEERKLRADYDDARSKQPALLA